MRKIKWGVIGCGGIADRRTLPGMMLAQNAELVAVMDVSAEFAENCKKKYNAKYAFTDMLDLLKVEEIEAVYIATPVFCHKEQVLAAADYGKHILLEKPMGLTVDEAKEITEYCDKKGVKLGVGFVMRFHDLHRQLKEYVQSGRLGEIVSARAQFSCWYPESGAWRQKKALSGGGSLMDMGVHCVDIIRYITGLNPVAVSAMTGNQIFKYEVEDSGMLLMRLENGAMACVDASFNVPDNAIVGKLELCGTKGGIVAEGTLAQDEVGTVTLRYADPNAAYDANQVRDGGDTDIITCEKGNLYTKEVAAFGDSIINDTPVPVAPADAIISQQVIEAAYRSNDSGTLVKL